MKFTCTTQHLVEAVSNVQRAVSAKTSLAALEGIFLRVREDHLELCGYDLELGITTEIPAVVLEPGSIVLNARLFGDIVRRLPSDTVTINTDPSFTAHIAGGASEYDIMGISPDEYPELPTVVGATEISLQSNIIKSMIRQTLFAVAETDNRPVHTGTLFEIEENSLRLVSVDGYRMAIRTEPIRDGEELHFVVPGKTLAEVLKLLPDNSDNVHLSIGRKHIIFVVGGYCVISRLLEGDFLDYHFAISGGFSTEVRVNTRAFIDSVERVSLLITDRLKSPVRCIFEGDEVKVSCNTTIGKANDELPVKIGGKSVEIGFNNRYLLDALRNTDCDEVKLQLDGPLSPMKVIPLEGDSFLFLVLPVRLQ